MPKLLLSVARANLSDAFIALRIIRAPLVVTALVAGFLLVPDQTREIYRAIAQDTVIRSTYLTKFSELGVAVVGLVGICLITWYVTNLLIVRLRYRLGVEEGIVHRALSWAPHALVLIISFAAASGIFNARTPALTTTISNTVKPTIIEMFKLDDFFRHQISLANPTAEGLTSTLFSYNELLLHGAVGALGLGILLVVILCLIGARIERRLSVRDPAKFLAPYTRISVYSSILALVLGFCISPVVFPQLLGPLGVFALFFTCLTLLTGQLTFLADRWGIPFLTLIALWGVALSLADLNDNHRLPTLADEGLIARPASGAVPPRLDEEFTSWFWSRKDRGRFEKAGLRYPIYIVAAPGGGIYAAFHTAVVLGRIQEQCPFFSHHLFGISGVSGGSLGAATFAGLTRLTVDYAIDRLGQLGVSGCLPMGPTPYKGIGSMSLVDAADTALSDDLLSPLFGALLFPDFLQRFLPAPFGFMDRGRRLDFSFEEAMQRALNANRRGFGHTWSSDRNPLAIGFSHHWSASGSSPALVLTTTEVETGRRRIIAPFVFEGEGISFLPIWAGVHDGPRDIAVSAAVSLSARFPWITPAGWFQDVEHLSGPNLSRRRTIGLVDGGYFENSGVATAIDLIRSMQATAQRHGFGGRIEIVLIVLTSGDYPGDKDRPMNELLAPVQALLNTRGARAYITIAEAEREFNKATTSGDEGTLNRALRFRKLRLAEMGQPVPLGWRLSTITSLLVRAQAGDPTECEPNEALIQTKKGRFEADCVIRLIYHELQADLQVAPDPQHKRLAPSAR